MLHNKGKWCCQACSQSSLAALPVFSVYELCLCQTHSWTLVFWCVGVDEKRTAKIRACVCSRWGSVDVVSGESIGDLAVATGYEKWGNKERKVCKVVLWIIIWLLFLFIRNCKSWIGFILTTNNSLFVHVTIQTATHAFFLSFWL